MTPNPSSVAARLAVTFGLAAFAMASVGAITTYAQSYSQLQVLLPGETPAPGTSSGKTGVPRDQVVGVPFDITVRACDTDWNTVSSITHQVSFESTDDTATLPGAAGLQSGERTFQVTLNASGSFTITVSDETDTTIPSASSAAVTVARLTGFEFARINQKNQYAGVPMSTTVTAVDPGGNPVAGYSGDVRLRELTSYGPGRIDPDVVTLTNGEWTGMVTNYRADETSINRGNVNMEASLDSDPAINGLSDPFTVHPGVHTRVQIVLPGESPLPGSVSGLSGSPASQAAGQSFSVDVYATDDWWNPVPSFDSVRLTSSDGAASTPVTGSLNDGWAAFTMSLGTVGTQTVTVTDQTNSSILGMTSASVQVTASAADHFEIDTFATPVTAGSPVAVTIRATDATGNTIPDYVGDAILTANTGPGSVSPSMITFSAGVWTGDITFFGAGGAVAFTVSDFSTPPHTGTSIGFEVLAGPYVGLQVLAPGETPAGGSTSGKIGSPSNQAAGSNFDVRVRAVDAYFNRVPSVSDQVQIASSDPFATLPGPATLSSGEAVLPVTLFAAGAQTVTAVDLDDVSIAAGTSETIPVVAGAYSRIVLIVPGEALAAGTPEGRTGTATDQSINFSFTCSVYATDEWFNAAVGVTDVIRFTSSDPLAELPPDAAMVNGRLDASVRLSTGGFQQLTVSNVNQPTMPVSTTQVRAISSGFHLEADVTPTAVAAGEPFTLIVRVTNDAGSVIQEINSTVDVEVRNASSQDPGRGTLLLTQFQLLQGQRAVQETYTASESIVLVVTDDAGNDPAVTEVVVVSPGPPADLLLSSDPTWYRGNRHGTITANVVDVYGNGVPDQAVTFAHVQGAGTLTPIDDMTDGLGLARADYLSPRQAEVGTVRATSGVLVTDLDVETSLVSPSETPGYVTNYPNPFHPGESTTTIAYKLSADANVSITFYTILGAEILREEIPSGTPGGREGLNQFLWDGRNGAGDVVASGGYLAVIEADDGGETLHVMRRRIGVVR